MQGPARVPVPRLVVRPRRHGAHDAQDAGRLRPHRLEPEARLGRGLERHELRLARLTEQPEPVAERLAGADFSGYELDGLKIALGAPVRRRGELEARLGERARVLPLRDQPPRAVQGRSDRRLRRSAQRARGAGNTTTSRPPEPARRRAPARRPRDPPRGRPDDRLHGAAVAPRHVRDVRGHPTASTSAASSPIGPTMTAHPRDDARARGRGRGRRLHRRRLPHQRGDARGGQRARAGPSSAASSRMRMSQARSTSGSRLPTASSCRSTGNVMRD